MVCQAGEDTHRCSCCCRLQPSLPPLLLACCLPRALPLLQQALLLDPLPLALCSGRLLALQLVGGCLELPGKHAAVCPVLQHSSTNGDCYFACNATFRGCSTTGA